MSFQMLHAAQTSDSSVTVLISGTHFEVNSDHLMSFSKDLKFERSQDTGFVWAKPESPAEIIMGGNKLHLVELEGIADTLHFRKNLTVGYSYYSRLEKTQSKEMFSFKKFLGSHQDDSTKEFVILNLTNELFIENLGEGQSILVPKLNLVGGSFEKAEGRLNNTLQVFGPGKVYLSKNPPTQRYLPPPNLLSAVFMFLFRWLAF